MQNIYHINDKNMFMKNIKIDKYKLDELLNIISEDNFEYGLIFKLCYVYGRLMSEVYNLHSSDIDFDKNTIMFKINDVNVVYPLYINLKSDLMKQTEGHKEYLFHHIYDDFDKFIRNLNYHLSKYDAYSGVHISPKDFKKLRGQHLIVDGVPIETVQMLYHGKNLTSTKRMLDYNDLMGVKNVYSLGVVFDDFTF